MAGATNAWAKAQGWKAADVTRARAEHGAISHELMARNFTPKKYSHAHKAIGAEKAKVKAAADAKQQGDVRRSLQSVTARMLAARKDAAAKAAKEKLIHPTVIAARAAISKAGTPQKGHAFIAVDDGAGGWKTERVRAAHESKDLFLHRLDSKSYNVTHRATGLSIANFKNEDAGRSYIDGMKKSGPRLIERVMTGDARAKKVMARYKAMKAKTPDKGAAAIRDNKIQHTTFDIATRGGGREQRKGYVLGDWAAHKEPGKGSPFWTFTYRPMGMSVSTAQLHDKKGSAMVELARLHREGPRETTKWTIERYKHRGWGAGG